MMWPLLLTALTLSALVDVSLSKTCSRLDLPLSTTYGASSIYDTTGRFVAENAFKGYDVFWWSGRSESGTGDRIITLPHLVYLSLATAVKPCRAFFTGRKDKFCEDYGYCAPTEWEFVGSNDASCNSLSAWTILCSSTNAPFDRGTQTAHCDREDDGSSFKCLGIRVLDSPYPDYPATSISGARFYKF